MKIHDRNMIFTQIDYMEKTPLLVLRNQLLKDAEIYLQQDKTEIGLLLLKYSDHITINLRQIDKELLYGLELTIREQVAKEYLEKYPPETTKKCVLCRTFLS